MEESDVISLEKHGWTGCSIPTNLDNILSHLPTWKHLRILRPPELFGGTKLQFPWEMFYDLSGNAYLPAFEKGHLLGEGTYGKVFKARRALFRPVHESRYERFISFHEIVSKQTQVEISSLEQKASKSVQEAAYAEEIQALLYEATLHAIVYNTLQSMNLGSAVPSLYEVFGISDVKQPIHASQIKTVIMNMEYIAGETIHNYFHTHFTPKTKSQNDLIFIDILIQLCVYLDILQTNLRFNHRDLKVNNVLLRHREKDWSHELNHEILSSPWDCIQDIVILDFGFSCIACGEDNTSIIQAGCYFKPTHECMKEGRDLALFLYSLQAYYPLEERISPELFQIIRKSVRAYKGEREYNLFDGVDKSGVPNLPSMNRMDFDAGVYKFLRSSDVDVPGCAPRKLVRRLEKYLELHEEKLNR